MLRLTAERRQSLGRESGAHASHKTPSTLREDRASFDSSTRMAQTRAAGSRFARIAFDCLPFAAVPFAVFGLGEMHDRPLIGALCIIATAAVLVVGRAR